MALTPSRWKKTLALFPVEAAVMASMRADVILIGSSGPLVTKYNKFFVSTCISYHIKDKSVYVERCFTFIARVKGSFSDL
jgi:hypothetical protein